MANSRAILLKLVRFAMGWESDYTLPEDIEWVELLQMAHEQGVAAILLDGYEIYLKHHPEVKPFASAKDPMLKFEAIGESQAIESNYGKHVAALEELERVLGDRNIPFMLMKGFACSQYYPIPRHRACGDIDIYPEDKFDESNDALKKAGIAVDPYYYRHSASFIKNVMVENHRVLGDLRGPRKQTRALELQLKEEAKRQFTYGYSKFADLLTNLSIRYLNIPAETIPAEIIADATAFENELAERVFDYMFVGQPRERDENVWKFRWNNLKRVWKERWKYKEVYGLSVVEFLYYKTKGAVLREGE